MDALIGDCGFAFNGTYTWPNCTGMYHYEDATCDYSCLAVEYTFWALTSLLGGQSNPIAPPNRCERISQEWQLCTPAMVQVHDPIMTAVFRTPAMRLPTCDPDGRYAPQRGGRWGNATRSL
jgi:hypothetical protein